MDRLKWQQIGIPAIYVFLVGAIIVFAHSGLQGDHGLTAFRDAASETERLSAELDSLRQERTRVENLVRRLSPEYLDLELLEERARATLGLVRPDEIVVR